MFSVKAIVLSLGIGAATLLSGLSTNTRAAAPTTAPTTQAASCDGCKVTFVKVPNSTKGQFISYHEEGRMTCPSCKDAITNFFTTGKLEHSCSACGGNMAICEAHPN